MLRTGVLRQRGGWRSAICCGKEVAGALQSVADRESIGELFVSHRFCDIDSTIIVEFIMRGRNKKEVLCIWKNI